MAVTVDSGAWRAVATSLTGLVDAATRSHARALSALVALALLSFLPGLFQIPPVDRDEARFAQATKQMIETGDYVDIRFQDESRYKKPVGIYWMQAVVVRVAEAVGLPRVRTTIGYYRIPSFAGAIGAVIFTYWAGLGFVSRRAAVLAGAMMAASILLGVEARLAKTDAVLLMCCVAAMGGLGRAYLAGQGTRVETHPWRNPAVFWVALAVGILVKGPVILLLVGLTIVTLAVVDRSLAWLRWLKPLPGLGLLLLAVLPWFLAIVARSGFDFFVGSLGQDLFAKVGAGQESHGAPPGTYLLLFWVTFFPGAILTGLATPAVWAVRREPGARFLLAWAVPSWIVFELVATKLPHYVLPLYPAIAILIAGVIDHHGLSRRLWLARGTVWWFLIVSVVAAATVAVPLVLGDRVGLLQLPLLAGAVIAALYAWWLYAIDGAERALLRAVCATVLIAVAAFGATIPRMRSLFPSAQVARILPAVGCVPAVVTAGYDEPSLVFLAGSATRHADGAGAADFLYPGGCRVAVVERSQERAFAQRAEAIGLRYGAGPRIEGIDLGTGSRVSLALYKAADRAP